MREYHVGDVVVVDEQDGKRVPVGILTDRDLRARVVACGIDLNTAVSEVMTPKPVTAHPEDSVDDALVVLLRHGIHHLPVVADTEQGEGRHDGEQPPAPVHEDPRDREQDEVGGAADRHQHTDIAGIEPQ